MSKIIDAAAQKVGAAGGLVAQKFDAFLSESSPEMRAKSLREQWDAYMHQFEPKHIQFVEAGLRIRNLIAPLEQSLAESRQPQAQQEQRKAAQQQQEQQQHTFADVAISRLINTPLDLLKTTLKIGGFATGYVYGTVKGVAANMSDARAESISKHADESFFALEKSVREYVDLAPDASAKSVDVAKNRMRTAAEGFSHAVAAETGSMLTRAKSGDISRADAEDAIENRLSNANSLLNEAQKTANAAPGDKAMTIAKMSEELQRSIANMVESVMRALKSFFSPSSGKHP